MRLKTRKEGGSKHSVISSQPTGCSVSPSTGLSQSLEIQDWEKNFLAAVYVCVVEGGG